MLRQPIRARAGFGRSWGLSRDPLATIMWSRGKESFDFFSPKGGITYHSSAEQAHFCHFRA